MLDNPKWLFFFMFAGLLLGIFGVIMELSVASVGTELDQPTILEFLRAVKELKVANMVANLGGAFDIFWANYGWLTVHDEWCWIVQWMPFRLINIAGVALLAWQARKLLPFYE